MLKITKNSILSEEHSQEGIQIHDIIKDGCFPGHLTDEVTIEDNVTFADILIMLATVADEVDFIFVGPLSGLSIFDFLEELEHGPKLEDSVFKVEGLIVNRICEIIKYSNDETELIENLDFFGIGTDDEKNYVEYQLHFSPISMFADRPIQLDNTYEIIQHVATSTYIKNIDGTLDPVFDKVSLLHTQKPFTLFEVLDILFHTIAMYGAPDERDELRDAIFGEDSEQTHITNDKDPKFLIQEEIKELEKRKDECDKKEDYEKSAKFRDRIEELTEKLKNIKDENS